MFMLFSRNNRRVSTQKERRKDINKENEWTVWRHLILFVSFIHQIREKKKINPTGKKKKSNPQNNILFLSRNINKKYDVYWQQYR